MENIPQVFSCLREINVASTVLRLSLALLFGGLIGLERERKRRPAGFRTFMLVCLGAALTMLLGQYETLMLTTRWAGTAGQMEVVTDVARFGAQVINGIGFLGAGTIIVTGRQEVKGLTTAAGLWASACAGLAIGAGFYECILLSLVLIILSNTFFPLIENASLANAKNMNLYMEFNTIEGVSTVIQYIKAQGIRIFSVDLDRGLDNRRHCPNAVFDIRLPYKQPHANLLAEISKLENISAIEEI